MSFTNFDWSLLKSFEKISINNKAWFLSADEYPAFFLSGWFKYLKERNINYSYQDDINKIHIQFLGDSKYYWLGDINNFKNPKKEEIINKILNYSGPHNIGIYIDSQTLKLLEKKTENLFILDSNILSKYRLSEYKYLLESDFSRVIKEWPVVSSELESFFNLSKYLFKKDKENFFKLLNQINNNYNLQFFISYWSDQFFRALYYAYFMQKNELSKAKEISAKLPFYFIQSGWKTSNLNIIKQHLSELYLIDCELKTINANKCLDSWYLSYLYS